jgi:hypothetical protein
VVVTSCGRICLHRRKINLSKSLAGQAVGIREVENGIWLVSFMSYDSAISIWKRKRCSPSTISDRTLSPLLRRRNRARGPKA